MNMSNLLESVLTEMGFALLEYRGNGEFLSIAKPPAWFSEIWGDALDSVSSLALATQSPFLENFLFDAETFWASPTTTECQSETWIEKSTRGREIPVQARALLLDGRRVLALFSPDPEFREQVKTLQTARNALLDRERLNREIQKKEILLHCIVHDLSQPLSVMHVALDCLADESITERSKQFLKLGKLASNQQETMIRDILHTFSDDLRATLDAGTEGNASSDLLECARKTTTALGPTFEAKSVQLSLAADIDQGIKWPVRAEESRLQRIFSNLLENALRYSPAGARVTVGVESEGEFLKAFVEDEGPGLPKDLRPEQIFGLFMKGKQSGGKAGLGLYFCRITVERWGGTIGCVSLPLKGSRFWFRLPRVATPIATSATATETASGRKSSPVRHLRILFADDMDDIRTLTAHQLERHGHKVVAVTNGRDALKRFRSSSFDVVLLDQEMPLMTGDEVARAIRSAEAGKPTHAFLLASTGNTGAEDIRRLKQAGFDDVLAKPFCIDDLNAILSNSALTLSAAPAHAKPAAPVAASFDDLVARIGGDEQLLKRMICTFLRDTPKRLAALATALRRKDAAGLASVAHALKGSISIFGAEQARSHAERLQELGRESNLAAAEEILGSLKEEIANLQANLRGYASQAPAGPRSKPAKRQRPAQHRGKRRR
jgi:signal transduction histidine kinase/CheY-like chemotaxis protein